MLDAVLKALEQVPSRPFRAVLLKSAGLALMVLIAIGILADRVLSLGIDRAVRWLGSLAAALPVGMIGTLLALAAGLGVVAGAMLLMPVATALVASLFVDEIADRVEERYYPADPPGRPLPVATAVLEGTKAALFSLAVYACALPLLWFAGLGMVLFFLATAYVQGRVFFELSAMRFHSVAGAKRLRQQHHVMVFGGGLCIAAFLAIPIVGLAAPLFGTALMIHLCKQLAARAKPIDGGA